MINKPNLVKGIPTLIVRALPVPYYFSRYARDQVPAKAIALFNSYVRYLSQSLSQLSERIGDNRCASLKNRIDQLTRITPISVETEIIDVTSQLSEICTQNKDKIKQAYESDDGLKNSLAQLFGEMIDKTKILLINNSDNPEWVAGLALKLTNSCNYAVEICANKAPNFSDAIVNCELAIFASATPQSIHEEIELLHTYQKPGLVLGGLQKDEKLDQQTIRNGSWLRKRGVDVLFKIFSPIRLFTTIDKIYMKFLLARA